MSQARHILIAAFIALAPITAVTAQSIQNVCVARPSGVGLSAYGLLFWNGPPGKVDICVSGPNEPECPEQGDPAFSATSIAPHEYEGRDLVGGASGERLRTIVVAASNKRSRMFPRAVTYNTGQWITWIQPAGTPVGRAQVPQYPRRPGFLPDVPDSCPDAIVKLEVPLFAARANHRNGFIRIINGSQRDTTVSITATDDAGETHEGFELEIEAGTSRHFNAMDLEEGNIEKGIAQGLGNGKGHWRSQSAQTRWISTTSG